MTGMTHQQARRWVQAALDQELSPDDRQRLQSHLDECPACRAYQNDLEALGTDVRRVLHAGLDRFPSPSRELAFPPGQMRQAETIGFSWAGALALALLVVGLLAVLNGLRPPPAALPIGDPPQTPQSPTASPALTPVAAVQRTPGEPLAVYSRLWNGNKDLFLLDANSLRTNLTGHPAQDGSPAWSPDGSRIAFLSDRTGQFELYIVQSDGSGLVQLTQTPADQGWLGAPVWSPDGSALVAIHLTGVTERSEAGVSFRAAQLYTVQADGSGIAQIMQDQRPGLIGEMSWSPDGQWIAFTRSTEQGGDELRLIRSDGSRLAELYETASRIEGLAWSSDGQRIAYLTQGPWGTRFNSYVITEDAKIEFWIQALGESEPALVDEVQPASIGLIGLYWAADQQSLFFLTNAPGSECWKLETVQEDGQGRRTLPGCLSPQRGGPVFSADGKLLFPATIAGDGNDYGLFSLDPNRPSDPPRQLASVRLLDDSSLVIRPGLSVKSLPVRPSPTPPPVVNVESSGPGVLVPQAAGDCREAQAELTTRLNAPVELALSAPFEPNTPAERLPNDYGQACRLSYQGPVQFESLQKMFDAVQPWILKAGYQPRSVSTGFRWLQMVYAQADRRLLLEARWKPLDESACPDQPDPVDCPLPAEQKELTLTVNLARDPLTAELQTALSEFINAWKAGDAQALESLTPDLQAEIQDLAGLGAALGLTDPPASVQFNFSVRKVEGDPTALEEVLVHLTLNRRQGRTLVWASECLLTLVQSEEAWKIASIRPLD